VVALEENHIFTLQLLNSFRAGFNRDNVESPSGATAINLATADRTGKYSFIPGETAGAIDTTIPELNAGFSGGLDAIDRVVFHYNSWQAYDNLFYTKGIHSMKFGANFERIQDNTGGLNYAGGLISFNSLSDFLTNRPASIYADAPGKVNTRGLRQSIVGAYFQDDAHLRPNLTVNAGMRYEMATVITEVHNELSNLRVLSSAFPQPFLGSPYIQNPTKLNFEPRVGFAWDPFNNGKTAVRGGFGIFDILPLPVEMGPGVDNSYPFSDTVSSANLPVGSFPSGAFNLVEASAQTSHNYDITEFKPHRAYVMQWNFNIQRELTPSTTVIVGYVGGHGQHMRVSHDNADMVMPTLNAQGHYQWPCPAFVPTLTPQGSTINLCSDPGTGTLINQFSAKIPITTYNGVYFLMLSRSKLKRG
jgi:TonB dependent receptor